MHVGFITYVGVKCLLILSTKYGERSKYAILGFLFDMWEVKYLKIDDNKLKLYIVSTAYGYT